MEKSDEKRCRNCVGIIIKFQLTLWLIFSVLYVELNEFDKFHEWWNYIFVLVETPSKLYLISPGTMYVAEYIIIN